MSKPLTAHVKNEMLFQFMVLGLAEASILLNNSTTAMVIYVAGSDVMEKMKMVPVRGSAAEQEAF